MAILATETWTGANGAAWPSQWTISAPSGVTGGDTIQGNSGQISITSGYGASNAVLASMPSSVNMDVLVTVNKPNNASHIGIWLSASGGANLTNGGAPTPYNGYVLEIYGNADSFYGVDLSSYSAGNDIYDFQQYTGIGYGGAINVRFDRTGDIVSYRIWLVGSNEPSDWTATFVDPSPLGTGVAALAYTNDSSASPIITLNNLIVTADAVAGWFHI